MTMQSNGGLLGGYLTHLAAAGRTQNTINQRTVYVRQALAAIEPMTATTEDIEAWLATHPQWSAETRRAAIYSLRGFFGWLRRSGRRVDDPSLDLVPPRAPTPDPRRMPDDVLHLAIATSDPTTAFLLRLLATTGIRRAEAAGLHRDDLEGDVLRVRGKGGKVRQVPVPEDVAARIRQASGYVFPTRTGGPQSPKWVWERVRKATGGRTPHSLRHRYATLAYAASHDLRAVQRLLGHASIATTQLYVGSGMDEARAAASAAWAA